MSGPFTFDPSLVRFEQAKNADYVRGRYPTPRFQLMSTVVHKDHLQRTVLYGREPEDYVQAIAHLRKGFDKLVSILTPPQREEWAAYYQKENRDA